ncbi:MAG: Uma2 family endonuclease [Candidatus Solibacter usitatus]|nr:Uma2 family endonuclease [Candidatus Solibacter usitatus]
MGALPARLVTAEAFLSNPAWEKCEFVGGRVGERNSGTKSHGRTQLRCGVLLERYFAKHPGGYAITELRCRLRTGGRDRFYQPDVAVVLGDESPEAPYLDRAPDLVVEVRSPHDTIAGILETVQHYFAAGAKLGWVLLPEERSGLILTPGRPPRAARGRQVLDGGKMLPGLRIRADQLFA